MVNVPGSNVQPLLTCLEDTSSPPEDKTDAYLRLAEDLAREDKQFVEEVCSFSARILSVLTRDMLSPRIDLSQAALQAVGYCIYQHQIVSSLREAEMSVIIQDLCNVVTKSSDKNLCTRALWGIAKQHLSTNVIIEKLPVILNTVEFALQTFESTTVENEALEVVYRLISELPSESMTSTAGQWSKLVYPLFLSSAHKIREKALGILELGLKLILLAQPDVVAQLLPDLKGGLLSELAKLFSDKKEIFVLRAWTVLVTILGETLHKGGNLINDMLKIPEQGFKSQLPNVQNMSYSSWIYLIDNFAISPAFIGAQKKIKLLMMPLLLHSGKVMHKDIELARLQAWWHLVCTIKPEIFTTTIFSEVCLPLLQYYFNVNNDPALTPLGNSKDGLRELTLPVTPVARGHAYIPSPASGRSVKNTPKRKSVIFNKAKLPDAFVKQIMLLGCEMLVEILATNTDEVRKSKRLTEHLKNPILTNTLFEENLAFFLAVVKSALRSCGSYLEDELAISIWNNIVNWMVNLLHNGDPKGIDDVMAPLFLTANDILTCSCLSSHLVLKFLDVLSKVPVKYLLHPIAILSSTCCQGKPVFLLADILFSQLSAYKETYVDERFHIVFENLVDVGFEAPSGKLTTVHNVWLVLEGLASTVANVEDLWRFWSKVTDSVSECVTKTSDVNQGDSLEPDFSLMISLLSFPFKELFTGGLPVATTKELDRDLDEFFRLFFRCASLVPTAEANTCVEELSKSLITVVTQEKCKNVRFLDSISGLIYVMMDCVDFSAQTASTLPPSTSRGNLTPGGKSKNAENLLGNLSSLIALCAEVLSISYRVGKDSSGSVMVAPAVTVLAGSLSKLFASLTNPRHIEFAIGTLSSSISSFISHHCSSVLSDVRSSDKKFFNIKYLLKIEKLWTDILMCLQSRYTAAYDSQLLEIMSELLECTFCHQRRQFRNQTIMFWNATFGQANHLEYPASLRICLQRVLEKTPLNVPGWDQSKVASFELPATLQDSEEMTPKENIIKQDVVIANSPKRKHGASSPGKLKGSFLHKAFSSDKTDRLSPFKTNLETGNKRKSPGSANARRKLPLPLNTTDEKDFVVIAPSPKKKRLLTEHQKEVRKAKKLESGHPALYNMLDQSQDGTQFSDWSEASMTQSFNHQDVEMREEKNAPSGDSVEEQNGGETNKLESSVEANIRILLENNNDEFDQFDHGEHGEGLRYNERTMPEIHTLPGGIDSKELNSVDDDNDLIPSSQTTPSASSRQSRRSYIHRRTPRNAKHSSSREKSKNAKMKADNIELVKDILADVLLPTNLAENITTHEVEINKRSSSLCKLIDTRKSDSSETSLEARKKITLKTSPISSRTRLRKKPTDTPDKTKNNKPLNIVKSSSAIEQTNNEPRGPESTLTDMEEFSDHQMDDTQILQESPVKVTNISENEMKDTEISDKLTNLNEAPPSSPVASSSMMFVLSKNSTTGSPLNRPTRSIFSSPACSPTTGILKRNRGKADTPSPPGKTRHVSFAFPLKEEKEISLYPLDQMVKDAQDSHKETKLHSAEMTNNFTSIKATPTKSSTPPLLKEECVFPDLVECTTPVEQILPSLATSRWSRGLGHVVHAQNIRTVGNLSALTKDQVEKLPIRSPKVSTLRRVLRNFHENRAPKSAKVNQLRAIKEVDEEAGSEVETEGDIVNGLHKLVGSETTSIANDSEESTCTNNTPDLGTSINEPIGTVATPSTSTCPSDFEKMLTPRRYRALAKPTTLFENDMEIGTEKVVENETNMLAADKLSENQVVENFEESESSSTDETQKCLTESSMDVEEIEKEIPREGSDITEEKIPSALNEDFDIEVLQECELPMEPNAKVDCAETGYEMPVENVRSTEELEHENQEMAEELTQENQKMAIEDNVPSTEELKQDCREMAVDDLPTAEDVPSTEELRQENQEMDTVDPYVKAISDLLTLKSQQELTELPLNRLLSCQEQLMTILSNTTTAIRLKCEPSHE